MEKKNKKFHSAFTLIEALIVLLIFSVVTLTFYATLTLGLRFIFEAKNRSAAVSLANEKMEIIRNLKYEDVGVAGGIPNGILSADEDIAFGGMKYHVKTFIQNIDDPFDGTSANDVDYKRAKITVSWPGPKGGTSSVALVSRFVPPGVEQNVTGGGVLSINVMDSKGIGVPQSTVHVINDLLSPKVNVTAMTDNTGNLILPGAMQSIQGYYITVSKSGYETVNTIDPLTVSYTVTDTPASVVSGMLNIKSIIQDKLSGFKILSEDLSGAPLPGVGYHVEGGRILGFDLLQSPVAPTYNIKTDVVTDSLGKKEFSNISPGQIFITPKSVPSGYTLVNNGYFEQYNTEKNTYSFILPPGESNKEVKLRYAKNDTVSLLADVKRDLDGIAISGAKVVLYNDSGYSEELDTAADGLAFFPRTDTPLVAGSYKLKVTASGYKDYTEENITIDKLILKEVKLIAI